VSKPFHRLPHPNAKAFEAPSLFAEVITIQDPLDPSLFSTDMDGSIKSVGSQLQSRCVGHG
jgi:hypothetical protein